MISDFLTLTVTCKMKNNVRHVFCLSAMLIGMLVCFSTGRAWGQAPPGYRLIWSDEFNGATIDPANWGFDIGGSGWGNNELQYYTNRPENAFLNNGNLVIEARKESYGNNEYTSARLLTKGKRDFLFGRIDIRAKLPKGQGVWPALWSLGKNIDQVSWPACGEMDIMELLGHEPNKMYSTVHWAPPGGGSTNLPANYVLPSGDFTDDFHVFSMVWERDIIKFYVDDNLVTTVTRANITGNYPFNGPFFLIFNVAVGGNWPGNPNETTTFPQRMYVDYVRVFQQETSLAGPTVAAPTPIEPASRVISLFSNAYTNVAVDTWSASWDMADVEEVAVAGNATKKYSNLTYAGVEFHTPGPVIDASSMERFHADIWTPDASTFKLKLVDFGANGIYGGGDDTEHELTFSPTLGNWYSIDVPLSDFTGLTSRTHLAQLIIVGDGGNKSVWVDNVYFYKLPPTQPTVAAPTPTHPAANVKSLFSNAYTNLAVDTWSASWDQAEVEDVMIESNTTKKYSNLNYAGVEFHTPGPVVDASTMERFHLDVWTANASTFKVKLVDFGVDGAFGGGDDTEHELSFSPTLGEWFAIDVPLTAFTNMTSRSHLAQLIFVGGGDKTVWLDNIYFYRTSEAPTEPMVAAPTPTQPSSNVISLFSNAYTNVAVDTWSAPWDMADVEDVMVAGNATKKYSNLTFAGVEFHTPGPVVNATTMERFHADVWTANASAFKVKLVDFGANGTFGGGDDTEHELSFTPTLNTWFAIDVPLSSFTGMTSKAHVAQLILVGEGGGKTVWVDNVYFYKTTPIASEPTEAAPTPTQPSSNVISLFSNAYTNTNVDTWSASWDMADVSDVMVAGDATKKYSNLTFAGVEFHTPGPVVNATTMERFHVDVWTATARTFKVKLVDFGANGAFGGGDDTEHELSFTPTLGTWFSIDVPLSNFTGMTSRSHVAQLLFVADGKTAWIDNVYFYKLPPVEPMVAAPMPTQPSSNVISLFSNAYTNVAVDTWSAPWDMADVSDVMVAADATKKYSNLTFAGVEFHSPGPVVNATTMERFHADVWTANASTFKVKLVDFGANGTFGGGDDTEHELSFNPTLNAWFSIDVPLSNFTGMTSKAHVAQLIFVGEGGGKTVWIDNVYFYRNTAPAPTVSLSPMGNCGTPVDFSSTSNCGSSAVVWYNATTNEALPNLPAKTPTVTTSYYARCKSVDDKLSDKSEVVTFTVVSQVATPTITVSQETVCTGTTVTVSANCSAGSKAFWNTGVNENSFQVAFNNVTQQTFKAKCVSAGGCESGESAAKTVRWKAFDLTFINIGQSKSAVKASNNRSEWQSQFITSDGGPSLEESTQQNPTLYFAENVNKMAPRYWTIYADACALGTEGSLTFDMRATPETGVVRSYNTHENNAPYFMYGNRDGFTELYAQNHPAYGFYEDNGAGTNVYDAGLPKGLYKLSVRYWDQKGWGSIYPATRKPQGNVLVYQEYWFRIQSKDGIGVGAARVADSSQQPADSKELAVLPNPVTNLLRLQVQDSKGKEVKATLLDAAGRKVLGRLFTPETNTHQEEFEVGNLASGMYFLQVITPEKQATLKVVKVD